MKKLFFLFLFTYTSFYSQAPAIAWQKTYGGSCLFRSMDKTSDGGYIMAGTSNTGSPFGDITTPSIAIDVWIIKISSTGVKEWQRTIQANKNDLFPMIKQALDGGYILGINSESGIGYDKTVASILDESGYWILKLDPNGAIEWQKDFNGYVDVVGGIGSRENFGCLEVTNDGGYLIGGSSASDSSPDKTENKIGGEDYWVIKIDALGNKIWDNTIGGANGNDFLTEIVQTQDGGYILVGDSSSSASVDKTEPRFEPNIYPVAQEDYWVVKLDSNGIVVWDKTLGGPNRNSLVRISENSNGELYIVGVGATTGGMVTEAGNGSVDLWLVKLDANGALLWENSLGGNGGEFFPNVSATNDGGALISCQSSSNASGDKTESNRHVNSIPFNGDTNSNDYWVIKINPDGTTAWDKTLGGSSDEWAGYAVQEADGSYIVAGYSRSPISGDKTVANALTSTGQFGFNFWVVKLLPENLNSSDNQYSNINIYPNPTNNFVTINTLKTNQLTTITLQNALGQKISENVFSNTNNFNYPIEGESGMYFLSVENEKGEKQTQKIIKK